MIILNSLRLRRSKQPEEVQNLSLPETPSALTSAWQELFSAPQERQDKDISERENSAALQLLEKICSLLEQIAENTEKCLQKMDSAEDDDLKFS